MYTLSINMWFQKLMKQFFFGIDQVVYNFISTIYDLLISIARTSVLSQADILDMADRIYKLLAIFMIFKVTLSLITYVVNPDDFSDKNKGISKLSTNIIISLGLLILTPYIFNMAYTLQTIILEDNTLATLIFDEPDETKEDNAGDFINSAGDEIAFITMSAFFTPNTSITQLQNCIELTGSDGKVNPACSGIDNKNYQMCNSSSCPGVEGNNVGMHYLLDTNMSDNTDDNPNFNLPVLQNYVAGVNNENLGLMFRAEMAVATDSANAEFIMDYKYILSTVVGVVVLLLLISFCMDVALRSVKLAFLQLIAPIPILSYVDPKSGKDGMFKKWYQLCFKTYLSLFIRLLALYFAIYIISRLDSMTDIVDGSYVSNIYIKIFIIIGVLMFAKQLPKILEGLGIKLDGDGKFFLNPLKKFEESTIGGKNITGMARGAMVGAAGALSGAGIGRAFSGAWRGMTSGKGWKETGKAETEMNRKMRQAKLDGSTFGGRLGARFAGATGLRSAGENIARQKKHEQDQIDIIDNKIKSVEEQQKRIKGSESYVARKNKIKDTKNLADSIKAMETRAKEEIQQGNSDVGKEYLKRKADYENLKTHGKIVTRQATQEELKAAENRTRDLITSGATQDAIQKAESEYIKLKNQGVQEQRAATSQELADAESEMNTYLNDVGMKEYMTKAINGEIDDKTFNNLTENARQAAENAGQTLATDGASLHSQFGASKGEIGRLEREGNDDERKLAEFDDQIAKYNEEKSPHNDRIRELNKEEAKIKADESAIK